MYHVRDQTVLERVTEVSPLLVGFPIIICKKRGPTLLRFCPRETRDLQSNDLPRYRGDQS